MATKEFFHFSNEINNRLTALLGQVQLLLREDLSGKSRGRAEIIETEAARMVEVIRELIRHPVDVDLKSEARERERNG